MQVKRLVEGTVISAAMEKTIVVRVDYYVRHPIYQKSFRKSRKFYAHCEADVKVGDKVRIQESRPMSKTKRWIYLETIN